MVFSATKGVTATVIHRLADRGLLTYDEPVAAYWPEFGANNKGEITVAQMLAPQSTRANPVFNLVAPKVAGLPMSGRR